MIVGVLILVVIVVAMVAVGVGAFVYDYTHQNSRIGRVVMKVSGGLDSSNGIRVHVHTKSTLPRVCNHHT